ncbi:hypothetical protein SAMN05443999_102166 [Roseovarius azorensis]|uniref:Sulfotransferase family protein n=1 Tax=Roseovarius azorensis TaxID=1287727 RepID=A0A1H7JHP0_9RHOB|nr:hypothetical protein [Roseovarius azorensis]SEK74129.1 hypothetical protein SAMN05443999_102166 [Roseovarius azorensis]
MRILLHPGFHKTGTSSLQRGALARAHDLDPHLRVLLTPGIPGAARAARRYSAQRSARTMARFSDEFAAAIRQLDAHDPRALMISSEDLGGHLPGLRDVTTYLAAPALVHAAVAVLRARFGARAEITVWFTTRAAAPWLQSLYWQNLRAQRLTDDFETFRACLAPAADHARIVGETRDMVGSEAEVQSCDIETCGATPLGPLGAALDLLGLSGDHLAPLPRHNLQPEDAASELLALNRSALADNALAEAKRAVLRKYRRTSVPED